MHVPAFHIYFQITDRITLLWTWFAILGAYVCQLLMAIALIISTQMVSPLIIQRF